MQKETTAACQPLPCEEDLIDTLIAISVVAKRLATKLRLEKMEGEKKDEPNE